MDGTCIIDSSYEINEYKPTMARAYTHNDHKHSILDPDRGPTRIRPIPQEHTQKKVVGDGGAKHRSIDPPTAWHNVADPDAVATIPQGGPVMIRPSSPHTLLVLGVRCIFCSRSKLFW